MCYSTYISVKNKAWRREFIICTIIYWGTGVNGTYCIVTYAHTIIAQWDVSFEAKMQTLSVPILMVLGCIVPLTCVERMGRKVCHFIYMSTRAVTLWHR